MEIKRIIRDTTFPRLLDRFEKNMLLYAIIYYILFGITALLGDMCFIADCRKFIIQKAC